MTQIESLIQASPSSSLNEGSRGDYTSVKPDNGDWNLGYISIKAELRMLARSPQLLTRVSFRSDWDNINGFPRSPRKVLGSLTSTLVETLYEARRGYKEEEIYKM